MKNLFKIFTGAIEVRTVTEGEKVSNRLRGIASGTSLDAEGDRMSEKALAMMENQIVGLTLHKDHVFKVDNTLGHFVDAKILANPDGDVQELWVEAELEPFDVNPDAQRIYEKIKSGTRLGFSVAGLLRNWERMDSKAGRERFLITEIELLSVDLVTIPAYRASQGSVSTIEGDNRAAHKNAGEIFVCKQIGQILRETDGVIKTDLDSKLVTLEQRISELEEMNSNKDSTLVSETLEKLTGRIEKLEASVVDPPKSRGLMIHPDDRSQISEEEIKAFETGSGSLLGKF